MEPLRTEHAPEATTSAAGAEVVDISAPRTTRVTIDRRENPLSELSEQERMRLIIRVLCEIVAYGEPDEGAPSQAAAS